MGIACLFGIGAATLFFHLRFWAQINRKEGKNFHEGHYWTFQSIAKIQSLMPYFSIREIRTALQKLVDSGVLLKGKFHENKLNTTTWYAIDYDRYQRLVFSQDNPSRLSPVTNGIVRTCSTPSTKPDKSHIYIKDIEEEDIKNNVPPPPSVSSTPSDRDWETTNL